MKHFKEREFSLFNYMCDILYNFYEQNDLEHRCALESIIGGNYNTEEQREWLERFSNIWERVELRELEKEVA
jgi:hypothetical protein